MKLSTTLIAAALASTTLIAGAANAATVGHVNAGYLGDTTSMTIFNDSGFNFTDVSISSVGGLFPGQTEDLGVLLAGASLDVPFGDGGGAFSFDYDDYNGGCDGGGVACDTVYKVTATAGANVFVSNIFSPNSNLSGGLVDFTGNNGDSDVEPARVANIGGVPEASTWALMLTGFGGMGAMLRAQRRQRATATA